MDFTKKKYAKRTNIDAKRAPTCANAGAKRQNAKVGEIDFFFPTGGKPPRDVVHATRDAADAPPGLATITSVDDRTRVDTVVGRLSYKFDSFGAVASR